jgi:hypothetical protein
MHKLNWAGMIATTAPLSVAIQSFNVSLQAGRVSPRVVSQFGSSAAKGVGQGFNSFSAFKRAMGPAGPGQAWHHIVEQTPGNIVKFGNQTIHNTTNLMKLPNGAGTIHARVSGYYSSIQPFTGGQTVRQWLSTQSYQAQYDFGLQTLRNFG